ncbi:hypothetical protein Hanom_Chr00s000003g01601531 [Helianthus anomalus]
MWLWQWWLSEVVLVKKKIKCLLGFLIIRVFWSFHTNLTKKTNPHPCKRLSGNEIEKVGDYSCNFRKLGTKGEKKPNHRDYPGI